MTTFELIQASCAKCGLHCRCDTYLELKGIAEEYLWEHTCEKGPEEVCECDRVYNKLNLN